MEAARVWVRQPTTIAGFSAIFAAFCALYLKQLTWDQAIPVLAGAVVSIILPDNSGAQMQVRQLAVDVVSTKTIVEKGLLK